MYIRVRNESKQGKNPNSEKLQSRSAEYKANHKFEEKNGKEEFKEQ